jgi:hypothetical protein
MMHLYPSSRLLFYNDRTPPVQRLMIADIVAIDGEATTMWVCGTREHDGSGCGQNASKK